MAVDAEADHAGGARHIVRDVPRPPSMPQPARPGRGRPFLVLGGAGGAAAPVISEDDARRRARGRRGAAAGGMPPGVAAIEEPGHEGHEAEIGGNGDADAGVGVDGGGDLGEMEVVIVEQVDLAQQADHPAQGGGSVVHVCRHGDVNSFMAGEPDGGKRSSGFKWSPVLVHNGSRSYICVNCEGDHLPTWETAMSHNAFGKSRAPTQCSLRSGTAY